MKISGLGSSGGAAPVGARRGAGGGGFAPAGGVGGAGAATASSVTAGVGGVSGVEALLALQDVGGPLERRRRMIARGGRLLDDLDRVKLALLDGADGRTALASLRRSVGEARERGGEIGLDGVLDQIDLRAAVELAKAEMARAA